MKGEHYADAHMANIYRLFPCGLRGWDWVVARKFGGRVSIKGDLDTLNPSSWDTKHAGFILPSRAAVTTLAAAGPRRRTRRVHRSTQEVALDFERPANVNRSKTRMFGRDTLPIIPLGRGISFAG
jgi:hypothetical protein